MNPIEVATVWGFAFAAVLVLFAILGLVWIASLVIPGFWYFIAAAAGLATIVTIADQLSSRLRG